ncbi:hypothetical protein A2424_00695 [Candidatus Peribacteria bacterium RIFOXYC1_FULL_54_13]|nr:MAG: hypothetical protein A2198_04960 [Candidatus Peribacteria bacterium RIFOXYA1_FULL_56_14]OGJ72919.1 MAG: hypothetical protein A2217_06470 [Candidatus Peribacteria bacterium RIFOXYA2_FULL_55_28]OGJ76085.1 MAG: hypothetical protein A2327_04210 [Candidatus Peribacteria bacterium RIFOXYB2_FULL_54_17]OGJ79545.1 MAG: hypothetical protein A2424_00695 [Candidatus Peribacteria bacterium RIFOXYC1_FULL_54_13]
MQLLADTALHVLAQVIHVVFALPESDIEHELALWCGFKPERREAKVFQCSRVQQIDDPPAVDTVSCQSIGMPRKNASGITSLDHGKHFAEPGSARFFGSFCFAKRGDDFQLFSLRKFPQLPELRFDRERLSFLRLGGFACVEYVFHGVIGRERENGCAGCARRTHRENAAVGSTKRLAPHCAARGLF